MIYNHSKGAQGLSV